MFNLCVSPQRKIQIVVQNITLCALVYVYVEFKIVATNLNPYYVVIVTICHEFYIFAKLGIVYT